MSESYEAAKKAVEIFASQLLDTIEDKDQREGLAIGLRSSVYAIIKASSKEADVCKRIDELYVDFKAKQQQ